MARCASCRRQWLWLALTAGLVAAAGLSAAAPPEGRLADDGSIRAAAQLLQRMPLLFVPDQVAADGAMGYVVRGNEANVWLASSGFTYRLHPGSGVEAASRAWMVALDLVEATPRPPVGEDLLPTRVSYFRGPKEQWQTGLPSYGSVVYREPWPGVDLVVSGIAGELKSTFVVRPGADPSAIRLAYRGASAVRLEADGSLVADTPLGSITEQPPVAYQEINGRRIEVPASFELESAAEPGRQTYRFRLGAYDPQRELVVDPVTLVYCGYIGGIGSDGADEMTVDAAGNLYVVGFTVSTESTFPVAVGPDLTYNGNQDAYVAKVRADGSGLDYCGYIGGSSAEVAMAVAVDDSGNAYVAGHTQSTEATFPVWIGPDLTYNGGVSFGDAIVAKVNAAGTALEYCGYIGGAADDYTWNIAVDGTGRAYLTGETTSSDATFPVLVGPDITYNGGTDAWVARVHASGAGLDYCGYIGGADVDSGHEITVDADGHAYVTGGTMSSEASFPVAAGPDLTFNGAIDAFVARVGTAGGGLDYCGYIGGSDQEQGEGIALDADGRVVIVGLTSSTEANFPVSAGPDLTYNGGLWDAFVARVSADGTALDRCGYIGGSGVDVGCDIALDASGGLSVAGVTDSTEASFPVLLGPDLTYNGGAYDVFVARVNPTWTSLDYCGYIGGSGDEFISGTPNTTDIAVDPSGNVYVAGNTSSFESTFPVVVGPDLTFNGGGRDGFVARLTGYLFDDGFESGDTSAWSLTVP